MERHYYTQYSEHLQREMHVLVYGYTGVPIIVFPCQDSMCDNFENFGMIDVLQDYIDGGKIQLFSVDTVDKESWSDTWGDKGYRAWVQECYYRYIVDEVLPMVHEINGTGQLPLTLGCSLGATHAAIVFFRRPDLFGVPRMEAAGAAVATVAGQWIGAAAGLTMNLLCNKDINLTLKGFRPAGSTIKRIYAVGIPSIAMNAIGSVMTFAMNNILIAFSSTAVAVFGVYFKLQSFVFMPIFGINNGMVPIIGYNYGARQPKRITQTIKLAVCFAECIMLCGLILAEVFPHVLLGVFNASPTMLAMGILALRIIAIHFPMAGFNVISSSAFQALGRGTLALLVSVIRQLVVLVPAAWLLSHTGNVNAVWFAFPIAELVAVTLCAVFMRKCHRDILLPMEAAQKTAASV